MESLQRDDFTVARLLTQQLGAPKLYVLGERELGRSCITFYDSA